MLTDEEIAKQEQELKDMEEQIKQEAEENKEPAAPAPDPEPIPSPAPDVPKPSAPVESDQSKDEPKAETPKDPKDDPMEWAKAKGFKSPEDMARALLQKEREFHDSRQKEKNFAPPPPPPPTWQPQPEWRPEYSPPPRGDSFRDLAALYPQIDPEDLRRFMPVVVDAAEAIANRKTRELENQIKGISRSTERNNEIMTLMQDPAFRDQRVQKEIHAVLDADPTIFQRERSPIVHAYEKAMVNMARKQLQQGVNTESASPGSTPPVTASGGNGSAYTTPRKITEREFNSWSVKEMEAYLKSNGKVVPKK